MTRYVHSHTVPGRHVPVHDARRVEEGQAVGRLRRQLHQLLSPQVPAATPVQEPVEGKEELINLTFIDYLS